MVSKKAAVLFGFAIIMTAIIGRIVFAEETVVTPVDQTVVASDQQATSPKESEMQWAWGEITNLDSQVKTVTLKYLDYDTDQEKEMVLAVDEKTTFENIQNFDELKLGDTLSIDYIIGAESKNIAKNISFEKPDLSSVPTSEAENNKPVLDATQPVVPVEKIVAPELAQPKAQSETPVDSSTVTTEAPALVVPVASESAPAPTPVALDPVPSAEKPGQ